MMQPVFEIPSADLMPTVYASTWLFNASSLRALLEARGGEIDLNRAGGGDNPMLPLTEAAYQSKPKIIEVFLEFGANPNLATCISYNPLCVAIAKNDLISARILLDAGADVNFRDDKEGTTPLMCARTPEAVGLLIGRGANPYLKTTRGDDALQHLKRMEDVDASVIAYLASYISK